MKKVLSLILCGVLVVTLTGCGDNKATDTKTEAKSFPTLSCSADIEEDGMKMTETMNFVYDEKETEIKEIELVIGVETDEEIGSVDEYKEFMKALCEGASDNTLSCNIDAKGDQVFATLKLDVDDFKEMQGEDIDFDTKMSMKDVIKLLKEEDEDIVCKEIR